MARRLFLARRWSAFWKLLTDFWKGKARTKKVAYGFKKRKSCACPPEKCVEECMSLDLKHGVFKRFWR